MNKLLLLILLTISAFSAEKRFFDNEYKIKCIEGHKWIQFYEQRGLSMDNYAVGQAVQMFKQGSTGTSVPIKCEGNEWK